MRVGAVDLGTNTTRLLVADVEDGRVDEVLRRTRITRLGEGVDARRRLLPLPIARVRNVLADYRREARYQTEFADRYDGHPFFRIPRVIPERSAQRVLTSDMAEAKAVVARMRRTDEPVKLAALLTKLNAH